MRRLLLVLTICLATALPSYAAITGIVVNSDGQAVAGAKVSIFTQELPEDARLRLMSATPARTPLASTTSDSKGKFSFDSPKDPVVQLQIVASGYAPLGLTVERDDARGAIPLVTAATKQGRITAAGKPVAGAKVILLAGGEFLATTDAEGRYSAPDPSKWADRIVVLHPDFATIGESTNRFMASGKVAIDRALDAGSTITGRVVAEDGKTPAAGAALTLDNWPAGKSGDDGTFTIAHAPKKWESLRARSGNLLGERSRGGKDPVVVRLAKTATLSGSVRDVKTQAGLAGVEIRVRPGNRFDLTGVVAAAITDGKGNFTMAGVPPGSYDAVPIRPGYVIPTASVNLGPNDRGVKNLIATQLARVSGSLIDENKQSVAGARVQGVTVSREQMTFARPDAPVRSAMSAPDGSFIVEARPDADVQIEAQKKGYPSAKSEAMRFNPGERRSGIVLSIPIGFAVTGVVTDRKGNPLPGIAVTASDASSGPGGAMMVRRMVFGGQREEEDLFRTGPDGRFTLRVKEGSYDLSFKGDGFASKTLRAQQINASTKPVEVTLDPGVSLSGRVTRGGTGVEGVRIMLIGDAPTSTETGPDGSFRIDDLTPGQVMLSAMKQDEFIQQNRPVTIPANDVVIEVPPGGRIAGRAVDKESGQPVTNFNAGVSAARGGGGMVIMGPPMSRHFTSDDGSFVLENVPPGATNVIVNAPGYTSGRVSNVNVEEGKTVADIEVKMDHGVKVTGRVTGPDGAALGGVTVRFEMNTGLMMRGAPMNTSTAATDANGEYTMEAVERGEKTFVFSRAGYLAEQKTVDLSGNSARVDAQLSTGQRVSGVVVTDGGVPIADASVNASSPADSAFGGSRTTRTDGNGAFQLEGLTPGRYTFRAGKEGSGSGILRDFDISSGAPIRIVVASGGTITGHVNGLTAEELQQASVQAVSPAGGATGPVDANGNFRIEAAPTGTVRVSGFVGAMGPGSGRTSPVKSIQLEPGGAAQVDIDFVRNTIRGRVSRDGKPAASVMVMFSPQKAQAQTMSRTTTDANGNYEAAGLDDATYDVSVFDMQRGTPYRTTYEVKGSGTFNIDIKSSLVRGRVLDAATSQPVEEAAVQLREQRSAGPGFAMRTIATDAAGGFTIENVPPGTYNVSAEKEGYGTKVVDVTVGDGPSDLEIKLSSNAGVTLRIVDARDGRLLSAFVRVVDSQNKVVYESPMRFGGGGAEAMKVPLETGTYRATILTSGYATKTVNITSPSSPTIAMSPGGSIAVQSKGSALRRARLLGPDGREYQRGFGMNAVFTIDPSPGTTVMENIAPGMYTLQILGAGDRVESSAPVNVMEGQRATVDI